MSSSSRSVLGSRVRVACTAIAFLGLLILLGGAGARSWRYFDAKTKTEQTASLARVCADGATKLEGGLEGDAFLKELSATLDACSAACEQKSAASCGQLGERAKVRLEDALKSADATVAAYESNRDALKMYLLLTDADAGAGHLDVDWATAKFTRLALDALKGPSGVDDLDLRAVVQPHVNRYFKLQKSGGLTPPHRDDALVERTRKTLGQVRPQDRYYADLVGYLSYAKRDQAGDDSVDNRAFPPIALDQIFGVRPTLARFIRSRGVHKEDGEVLGAYTARAYNVAHHNLSNADAFLEQEAWVLRPADERGEMRTMQVERVAEDYESAFVRAWRAFFEDIEIVSPATVDEALALWTELKTLQYPYRVLLLTLRDNTRGAGPALWFKDAVRFADAPNETDLYHYVEILSALINRVTEMKRQKPALDMRSIDLVLGDARTQADALLETYPQEARHILQPLVDMPLTAASRKDDTPKAPPPTPLPQTGAWKMPVLTGRP